MNLMRHARRSSMSIAAVVVVVSLAVAGCGSEETPKFRTPPAAQSKPGKDDGANSKFQTVGTGGKGSYLDQVQGIQAELVSEVQQTKEGSKPDSQPEMADVVGQLADIFDKAAHDFESLEPPEEVADLHAQVVEQIRSLAENTRAIADTLRTGAPTEAQQALINLQTAATAAQTKLSNLVQKISQQL